MIADMNVDGRIADAIMAHHGLDCPQGDMFAVHFGGKAVAQHPWGDGRIAPGLAGLVLYHALKTVVGKSGVVLGREHGSIGPVGGVGMVQVFHHGVKQPADDKQRPLLFVFTPDAQQPDACCVSGFKIAHAKACHLEGSQPQRPQQRDHGEVSEATPGRPIEGIEQPESLVRGSRICSLPLSPDDQRQGLGGVGIDEPGPSNEGKKAFEGVVVVFDAAGPEA